MKNPNYKIAITLTAIFAIAIVVTVLSYLQMTKSDQDKFLFEVGKMLLSFTLVVVVGGTVNFLYTQYQEQMDKYKLDTYFIRTRDECIEFLKSNQFKLQTIAITKLLRLADEYKVRKQDVITYVCNFVRNLESKNGINKELLIFIIKSLTHVPRLDQNSHPVCIKLSQVTFQNMNDEELYGLNFDYFVLWGCNFIGVNLSRCSFKHADLGGTLFQNCGLEYCDFKGAHINFSPEDKRPTIFQNCQLWSNNLHESNLSKCRIEINESEKKERRKEIENLNDFIINGEVIVKGFGY